MAVAGTSCTADPTRDQMRRWFKHQWTCTLCTKAVRWHAGLGWHHYVSRRMDGVVFVETVQVHAAGAFTTSMPPRRALYELEATMTPVRPLLYLVPPLADPDRACTNSQCPCSLTAAPALPVFPEESSAPLAA